jgi:methylamine--corrinoid protein Co-methyltransferase
MLSKGDHSMINFDAVVYRSMHGPIMSSDDFDKKTFIPSMQNILREFNIQYDGKDPLPLDDDLADRVFEAGLKFYQTVGTYCVDSERVIRFSEQEIRDALKHAPSSVELGANTDRRRLVARKPEDSTPPWCSVGAGGAGVSNEQLLESIVTAYAKIPLANSITTPSLITLDGKTIVAETPLEVEGAIRTVRLCREALRRAGRPGLPMVNGLATAVSGRATIAGSHFGFRSCDGWEIASIAELKTNFDLLSKMVYIRSVGGNILAEAGPVMGGLAGGPAGTAVLNVAYHLEGILVKQACLHHPFPIHVHYGCNTGLDLLWIQSISTQALTRNSHFPMLNLGYTAAGPMTKMVLYETAAWVIASVVCGGNIEAEGVASATHVDHLTPLEPHWGSEVAVASLQLDRRSANELLKKLLKKYEEKLSDPPIGKRYQDCYNVDTGTPSPEYEELYQEVKGELEAWGLKF